MLHADVLNQAARQSVTASHSPQWQHNRPFCNLKFSLVPMVLRRISHYPHEVSQYPHCPMDSLSPNLSSPKFHRMHFLRGCTPQESPTIPRNNPDKTILKLSLRPSTFCNKASSWKRQLQLSVLNALWMIIDRLCLEPLSLQTSPRATMVVLLPPRFFHWLYQTLCS